MAHQSGLGDLDDKRAGFETTRLKGIGDVLDDGVVVELTTREIDRDVEGVARACQTAICAQAWRTTQRPTSRMLRALRTGR